jgi:aminoglycoside phosphotransferase (APT) family kinase protein
MTQAKVDEPGEVRGGDEVDGERVAAWLRKRVAGLEGEVELRQFAGGASNLTYLLKVGATEMVLRRPPPGQKAKSAHDMSRESTIIAALKPVYPHVPGLIAYCDDESVIGAEFFVMERLRGLIPRRNLPRGLDLDPAQTHTLCRNVIDRLIELHAVDYAAIGLGALYRGQGYTRRQVEGWSDRYRKAKTDDAASLEGVMAWLATKQPEHDAGACVVHNDFRFDNVVLDANDPMRVVGVLDWEMATIGDPLADLGNTLAYWVQADDDDMFQQFRRQPTHLPGMLMRQEVIEYYGAQTGRRVENFDFYLIQGLFRLAVIAQQIYYRFYHGQTTNPQAGSFGFVSHILEARCLDLIARSKL